VKIVHRMGARYVARRRTPGLSQLFDKSQGVQALVHTAARLGFGTVRIQSTIDWVMLPLLLKE
jgi:hypothetical protein